jgi:hypothetical protein
VLDLRPAIDGPVYQAVENVFQQPVILEKSRQDYSMLLAGWASSNGKVWPVALVGYHCQFCHLP